MTTEIPKEIADALTALGIDVPAARIAVARLSAAGLTTALGANGVIMADLGNSYDCSEGIWLEATCQGFGISSKRGISLVRNDAPDIYLDRAEARRLARALDTLADLL